MLLNKRISFNTDPFQVACSGQDNYYYRFSGERGRTGGHLTKCFRQTISNAIVAMNTGLKYLDTLCLINN